MAGIRVELELVDGQFTSRMLHAGESVKQFNDNIARSDPALRQLAASGQLVFGSIRRVHDESRGFLSTMRDFSIVTGAASMAMSKISQFVNGWAGEIVRVNGEIEKLTVLMRSMSRASDPIKDSAENVRYLRDMARETPFSLIALSEGFVRLKATGIDPMNGSMQAFADAVAGVGGSDVKLERVTLAISQMAGKGVIQMEELRQQLGEALPRATELMARSMGVSYAQLVKEVSTGRVMAGPAIEALRLELERVYGGAAIKQMQTYQGQLVRTKSLLMDLSTEKGNKAYFENVKLQLMDLNNFLSGNAAKVLADSLGNALSSVVTGIRKAFDTLVEFRHEIVSFAEMAALVIGGKLAVGAFGSLVNGINTARSAMGVMAAEFAAFQAMSAGISARSLVANLPVLGPASATTFASMTAFGAASSRVAALMPLLISGVAAFGALLPALGIGIWAASEYFDIFGTKAKRAWEELKTFGGVARKQVDEAAKDLDVMRNKLNMLVETQNATPEKYKGTKSYEDRQKRIDELNQLLLERERIINQAGEDVEKNEGRGIAEKLMSPVRDAMDGIRTKYDESSIASGKFWNEAIAKAQKAGESTTLLERKSQEETHASQIKFYDDQIALLDKFIAETKKRAESEDGSAKVGSLMAAKTATDEMIRYQKSRIDAQRQLMGIQKVAKVGDQEKNMEHARQLLENLKAKAAEYRAEIAGVEGEYAKLAYVLQQSKKFGDGKTDSEIQAMIDKLLEAQKEVDGLHEKLKGFKALGQDIDNALMDAEKSYLEELKKAAGKDGDLTKLEEIYLKLKNGLYKGIDTSSNVETLRASLNGAKASSEGLAKSLIYDVFGSNVTSAANSFMTVLDQIVAKWREYRGLVEGTDPSKSMTGPNMSAASKAVADIANTGSQLVKVTAGGLSALVSKESSAAFQGFLNDLVASGYKINRLEGYSNRAMTGNPNKLSEHAYGNAIDINPDQNPYGKKFITDMPVELIRQLAEKYNMTWGGDWKSIKDTMHLQWNGRQGAQGATQPNTTIPDVNAIIGMITKVMGSDVMSKLSQIVSVQELTKKLAAQNELTAAVKKEQEEIDKANKEIQTGGKRIAEVEAKIKELREKREGSVFTEEEAAELASLEEKLLKLAKERDAVEKSLEEKRKNRKTYDSGLEKTAQTSEEYAERILAAQRRIADPNELKLGDKYYALERELEKYVLAAEKAYGKDSEEYRKMLETKQRKLAEFKGLELMELGAKTAKENAELRTKLGTESQQRLAAYQLQVSQINAALEQIRRDESLTADQRLLAEKKLLEKKALLNQQYAANGPIAKQMLEWQDLGMNMQKAATGWLDSMADSVADFVVTGKMNFKSLAQSILKDMTKMMFKWAFSNMFGGKAGAVGAGGKKGGGATKAVGMKHTGGLVGSGMSSSFRMINVRGFANASRFHTGGMLRNANLTRALGLNHNEVPIIALRNEGVFTEDQMKVIAGSLAMTGTLRSKNRGVFTNDQIMALSKFTNAKRFHTGGIIGSGIPSNIAPFASGINSGIDGRAVGSGKSNNQFSVVNHIKVEGSAGTPEQNDDLAQKIGKHIETTVKQVVVKELMTQTRPGGVLRQPGRTGK